MAGFDAGAVVDPLDYTFLPDVNVHGVIKEPSDKVIATYMRDVKQLVSSLKDKLPEALLTGGDIDITQMFAAADDLDPDVVVNFHTEMAGLFAKLCSGEPSKTDILGLPIRKRVMFYAWLLREVMSPEPASGDGKQQGSAPQLKVAG